MTMSGQRQEYKSKCSLFIGANHVRVFLCVYRCGLKRRGEVLVLQKIQVEVSDGGERSSLTQSEQFDGCS